MKHAAALADEGKVGENEQAVQKNNEERPAETKPAVRGRGRGRGLPKPLAMSVQPPVAPGIYDKKSVTFNDGSEAAREETPDHQVQQQEKTAEQVGKASFYYSEYLVTLKIVFSR